MKTRYSPSNGCFYPFDIDYRSDLPEDMVEVSLEDFHAAMARQKDHTFQFVDGKLVITALPPVPFADLATPYLAEVRATRELILNRLAGIGMAAVIGGDNSTAGAIAQIRQQLLDITQVPPVVAAMAAESLAALEEAVKARYKEIAGAAPIAIRTAFNQVSQ